MPSLMSRIAWIAYLTVCFSLLVLPAANAYIDPGSGSLIFQVAVGFAMASALAAKTYWRRFIRVVSRRRRSDDRKGPSSSPL